MIRARGGAPSDGTRGLSIWDSVINSELEFMSTV